MVLLWAKQKEKFILATLVISLKYKYKEIYLGFQEPFQFPTSYHLAKKAVGMNIIFTCISLLDELMSFCCHFQWEIWRVHIIFRISGVWENFRSMKYLTPLANPFVRLFYSQQEKTVGTYSENWWLLVKDTVMIWVTLNYKSHHCTFCW